MLLAAFFLSTQPEQGNFFDLLLQRGITTFAVGIAIDDKERIGKAALQGAIDGPGGAVYHAAGGKEGATLQESIARLLYSSDYFDELLDLYFGLCLVLATFRGNSE